ncbi:MAG: transposase [Leptolyngbya sp. SIO4C5]|nr:transposase [Leptolyngbya sp. SIO4C5]
MKEDRGKTIREIFRWPFTLSRFIPFLKPLLKWHWRLALITVMQHVELLLDRQAAEQVRARIDWKYALSLELTDSGFDHSVLSEFRDRLLKGNAEEQLLNLMLVRLQQAGLLKAGGQQRSDSTHVVAAVRAMNRIEFLGETVRYVLNAFAEIAPTWPKTTEAVICCHLPLKSFARKSFRIIIIRRLLRMIYSLKKLKQPKFVGFANSNVLNGSKSQQPLF